MPAKPNASSKEKDSSAKKRQASKGPDESGGSSEQVPVGRTTVNSLSAAGLFPPPSRELTPLAKHTIKFEGCAFHGKSTAYPGGTGRPSGRSQGTEVFPRVNDTFVGVVDAFIFRIKAEKYLEENTKSKIPFHKVMALVQVEKSKNFHQPTIVSTDEHFAMLNAATEERPDAIINVRLEWNVEKDEASSIEADDPAVPSSSLASPSTAVSGASFSSRKKRASASSSGSSAIERRIPLDEGLRLSKEIAAKLHRHWPLCNDCVRTRAPEGGLCWADFQQHHRHLTQQQAASWANAIRDGKGDASYDCPPTYVLDKLLDATSPPRGVHAARAAAGASSQGSSSQGYSTAGSPTAAFATTPSRHVDTIDLTGPSTPHRLPFANLSNNSTVFASGSQVKVGPAWPVKEWVQKDGNHHAALATKLFDEGLVSMAMVARSRDDGSLADLELTKIQRSIIAHWIDEWKSFELSYVEWEKQAASSVAQTTSPGGAASA